MKHKASNGAVAPPNTTLIRTGIPIFLVAIIVEFTVSCWVDRQQQRKQKEAGETVKPLDLYRLNDSVANFSNGLLQQMFEVLTKLFGDWIGIPLLVAIPYSYIFDNYRLMDIDGTMGFLLMVFGRDLGYYWFHRAAHRVNFMWAVHGVHHRPNEFNYTVNLSQGVLQRITSIIFYVPLALFFNPTLFMIIWPMEKIFGFFTHTRLLGKMRYLEWIFVTPSIHRVHHAGNPSKYIDKNYGEMFSFWDRMFGTFEEELEPICYGHIFPFKTWDPISAQIDPWREMFQKAKKCPNISGKLWCFFGPPGWNPVTGGEYELPNKTPYNARKFDSDLPTVVLKIYCVFHFTLVLGAGVWVLNMHAKFASVGWLFVAMAYIALSCSCVGKMFDRNPTVLYWEVLRLLLLVPVSVLMLNKLGFGASSFAGMVMKLLGLVVVLSLPVLWTHHSYFVLEDSKLWAKRVWIPEAGRGFGQRLEQAKQQAATTQQQQAATQELIVNKKDD